MNWFQKLLSRLNGFNKPKRSKLDPWMFNKEFLAHSFDVDACGQLRPASLCRWMQEVAWQQADSLGFGAAALKARKMIWALHEMYLEFESLPMFGANIHLKTWPVKSDATKCYREYQFRSEESVFGKATTSWLGVDQKSRRIIRTKTYMDPETGKKATMKIPKMSPMEDWSVKGEIHVHYRDLDLNKHVNNVRYVEWLLDAISYGFLEHHQIRTLQIQFKNEALYGDELEARMHHVDEGHWQHALVRKSDNAVVVQGASTWEPCACKGDSQWF